ncbi:MAG: glycosyltransferase family 4 protein [Kiritimatiellia bacterium]
MCPVANSSVPVAAAHHCRLRVGVNALFFLPGEVGGSETYLCSVLEEISSAFSDVSLLIYSNRENDKHLRNLLGHTPNVTYRPLGFRARNRVNRILREQTQLPRLVARDNLHVLWSPGYVAPLRVPCPQVVTIFDMQYKSYPESLNFWARLVTDFLLQRAAVHCTRILTLSEFGRAEILRHTKASPSRITVTPAGADFFLRPPAVTGVDPEQVRKITAADPPYILSVGNSYPHKNLHLLVDAFALIAPQVPHRLVLVGISGRGEGLLQRSIGRSRHAQRILRLRNLSTNDLLTLYQNADLFVFPSLYEGFGLPVLEAMATGVPVLATRCGAIPEIGADAVRYFDHSNCRDLAQKIREMLALPPQARKSLIETARQRAAQFTWRATAETTVACLRAAAQAFSEPEGFG